MWPDGNENDRSTPATTIETSGGRGRAITALSTLETRVASTIAPASRPGSHHVPERRAHTMHPTATRTGSTNGPNTFVTTVSTPVATGVRCATIQASSGSSNRQRSSRSRTESSRPAKPRTPTRTRSTPGQTLTSTARGDVPSFDPLVVAPIPGGYGTRADDAARHGPGPTLRRTGRAPGRSWRKSRAPPAPGVVV